MTINTTQPVDKRFKKNFNDPLLKMTFNEQIKILDNKIRSNQAQYDLDRQNEKQVDLLKRLKSIEDKTDNQLNEKKTTNWG